MTNIEKIINNFIKKHNLDKPELVYLVAFSGGYDSMCFLNSLKKSCENKIIAIHLNHNWRGAESDREEQNCKDFCQKIGVDFYSEKLSSDVAQTETAARDARYLFFERCAKRYGSNIIFTAHNKNDNVETLIYRIAHGTGVKGLCGISEIRDMYYRPLLTVSRLEIEKYCKDNDLKPNLDSSNNDIIHKRNLIRREILPQLSQINPNIIDSVSALSYCAKEDTGLILEYITSVINKISEDNKYKTKDFLGLSNALQMRILYEMITPLVPQNYDKQRIETVLDFININKNSKSGKICSITTNYNLFVSEKYFELISSEEKRNFCIKVQNVGEFFHENFSIKIEKFDKNSKVFDKNKEILVDLSNIAFDLEIRTRKDGDFIQPLGMQGHQKLKKYLNSRKIPNHEKDNLFLLTQGKEVLWVVGFGLSDKIKVKTIPTHKITINTRD